MLDLRKLRVIFLRVLTGGRARVSPCSAPVGTDAHAPALPSGEPRDIGGRTGGRGVHPPVEHPPDIFLAASPFSGKRPPAPPGVLLEHGDTGRIARRARLG